MYRDPETSGERSEMLLSRSRLRLMVLVPYLNSRTTNAQRRQIEHTTVENRRWSCLLKAKEAVLISNFVYATPGIKTGADMGKATIYACPPGSVGGNIRITQAESRASDEPSAEIDHHKYPDNETAVPAIIAYGFFRQIRFLLCFRSGAKI